MFQNPQNFTITGGEFTVVQGNVTNVIYQPPSTFAMPDIPPLPLLACPSGLFTGREHYLQLLKDHFAPNTTGPRKLLLLHGMGGIGKTQICLKFIEQNGQRFSDIFWIDASSESSIDLRLRQIAKTYNISPDSAPSATSTLQWISARKGWLIVFDNADGDHRIVAKFLPPGTGGNILITSRNKRFGRIVSAKNLVEVTEMAEDEAINLVLQSAMIDDISEKTRVDAKKLVNELGYIPLAIDQAGAYIQSCDCGLDYYLKLFMKHHSELMSGDDFRGESDYQYSTYGTWDISIEEIKNRANGKLDERALAAQSALVLHRSFAFLHYESISEEIFKRASENYMERRNEKSNNLPQSISFLDSETLFLNKEDKWDELHFQRGVQVLLSFSLIKSSNKLYSIHPLVHVWSRDRIPKEDAFQTHLKTRALIACSITIDHGNDGYTFWTQLVPHIQAISIHLGKEDQGNEYFDDECTRYGFVFHMVAIWETAEEFYTRAMEMRNEKLGTNHPDTLFSKHNLASIYWLQGRLQEAEKLEAQVVETRMEILGQDHLDAPSAMASLEHTLSAMANLAAIYRNQKRWQEAEKLELLAVEVMMEKFGMGHPDTLSVMSNLAITYWDQGRWQEAEELEVQVMKASMENLGALHPRTLTAMGNLASTYQQQRRWQEAENLEVQVMEGRRKKFGMNHPDTFIAMGNLASTYRSQGRWQEAEVLEIQVVEAMKEKLGTSHPNTLSAIANLAATYRNQGRWQKAEKLEVEVMESRNRILGTDHLDTLSAMVNLAGTWINQRKWKEAEKLLMKVVEGRKAKLGVDHLDTLSAVANLATTYSHQGRWQEAQKLEVQVLEARKEKLGTDHIDTFIAISNLAATYRNQGKWQEAEKLDIQVMDALKEKLGVDHPETLTAMGHLAFTYMNQGRWQEAEKLLIQVMEARKEKLGPEHPDTLTTMGNIAATYWNQERWCEAEQLQIQVMEAKRKKLGTDHPDTLNAMTNLAATYWKQGRCNEAEKLQMEVIGASKGNLGTDHPGTLSAMANLAIAYCNQGRWQEAETLLVQVVEVMEEKLGADHPNTLSAVANLATIHRYQQEAEKPLKLPISNVTGVNAQDDNSLEVASGNHDMDVAGSLVDTGAHVVIW